MRLPATLAVLALSALAAQAAPPAKDVKGSADPAALGRYEGSVIVDFATSAYDEASFPTAKWDRSAEKPEATKDVEGKVTRVLYLLPRGRSPLEVLRNYQETLQAAGGKTLFECKTVKTENPGGDCGSTGGASYIRYDNTGSVAETIAPVGTMPSDAVQDLKACLYMGDNADLRYFTGTVERNGATTTVGVATWMRKDADYCRKDMGPGKLSLANEDMAEQPVALVVTVEEKAREQKMVTVKADAMAAEIAAGGKVALYGITFDFDKADIKPESKPQLDEIGGLLKATPELKLIVSGHTDNQGGAAYNLELSKKRAEAVVAALVSGYGIKPDRLMAQGLGSAAPVASNDTEDGKAKNRRVELVKQ